MTTGGEGGMVTTDDPDLWASMWAYKDHGKDWKTVYEHQHPPGFRWLHASFGTNWRMLEVQAVLGRLQLKKMTAWSEVRMANARKIWSCAESFKALRVPKVPADCTHAAYKCYVFVEPQFLKEGWNRDRIISSLVELEVPCFSGSCSEVYLEKAFDNTSFRPSVRLPIAKELGERSLMFLVHPTLTESNMRKTCEALTEVMLEASR